MPICPTSQSRRRGKLFWRFFLACATGSCCWLLAAGVHGEETPLPVGGHPAAIEFGHFPSRLHAVVWRNWNLVEVGRIARTVGATPEQIERVAASMGLPPAREVPEAVRRGTYITVVRRNWHLLPYDQLLTLLGMTAEELSFSLREDDFLFVKLGNLKPKCEPLRYEPPDEATRERAAEIRAAVERHFGDALARPGEPRLAFIERLSAPPENPSPPQTSRGGPRYIYSYYGSFGDPLSGEGLDPYPDGLLARLAEQGVNGVWLHVVLRQLAPGGEAFPEFGDGWEKRLANLKKLVGRAKRRGLDVYLYLNEPRAMPAAFFNDRPEMAGVREGDHRAMCTSDPRVRKWLGDAVEHVFREVPELGGAFTITASENLTHCASHGRHAQCPRCKKRTDAEIIAEVNAVIAAAAHRANPEAKIIAWDWGWKGHGYAPDIIAKLPPDVWLMSVSEWAKPIERGGVKTRVGEYSISAVGPGPRAARHWRLAKQAGLKTLAKVQLNTTWELASMPYLPVLDLVAEHCANLRAAKIDGMMLSWSLGGYPSPNLQVARRIAEHPEASADDVLDAVAAERYGESAAPHARRAWTAFSEAFRQYPYHGSVVYTAPQQMGPANLLYPEPTGYAATMVGIPYDDLNRWRGPYPAEVFAAQFEKVADGWREGLDDLRRVVETAEPEARATAQSDLRVATAAMLHFASVANQARFVMARDALAEPDVSPARKQALREEIARLIDAEIALAKQLFPLVRDDSRLGFEASNHYFYVPLDLVEKVVNCEYVRTRLGE